MRRIGFDVKYSGNLLKVMESLKLNRANRFQFFLRGFKGNKIFTYKPQHLETFREFLETRNIREFIIHAPYHYNLSKPNRETVDEVIKDLQFAKEVGASYYVINPCSIGKESDFFALETVKSNLLTIWNEVDWEGEILIKNSGGAGTQIPVSLRDYNELVSFHPKVQGAIDFARLYSAGYDFTNKEKALEFFQTFDEVVGWEKVKLIYINDYHRGLGSRKDDFTYIGNGFINKSGYESILGYEEIQSKIWLCEYQHEIYQNHNTMEYLLPFFK